jgi:hypothetical protein
MLSDPEQKIATIDIEQHMEIAHALDLVLVDIYTRKHAQVVNVQNRSRLTLCVKFPSLSMALPSCVM